MLVAFARAIVQCQSNGVQIQIFLSLLYASSLLWHLRINCAVHIISFSSGSPSIHFEKWQPFYAAAIALHCPPTNPAQYIVKPWLAADLNLVCNCMPTFCQHGGVRIEVICMLNN